MNIYLNKAQENQSRIVADNTDGGSAAYKSTFQFKDNRPKSIAQRKQVEAMAEGNPIQKKNKTDLPDQLKTGIESLSGHSMDDVSVHYNSDKPAQLNARAYTQGTDIHIAAGQEKHLPHEAWHVVQQKQGRVQPTAQMKGKVNINDDKGLEKEADVMGSRALQMHGGVAQFETGPGAEHDKMGTFGQGEIVQRALFDSALLGTIGAGLGLAIGTFATGGLGAIAMGFMSLGAIAGSYEGMDVEAVKPAQKDTGAKINTLKVYYSNSTMGHFTLFIQKPGGQIFRLHFVIDQDVRNGIVSEVKRKIKQLSGYASGLEKNEAIELQKFMDEYENSKQKTLIGQWKISDGDSVKILQQVDHNIKISPHYGYVTYSSNVDNCGSYLVKVLAKIGIGVTLPRYKTWLNMPRMLKTDVVNASEKNKTD